MPWIEERSVVQRRAPDCGRSISHDWIEKNLRENGEQAGTDLLRIACKMATGGDKTVVMSMLIAWCSTSVVTHGTNGSRTPFCETCQGSGRKSKNRAGTAS
jgi:hypothetical protein